MYGMSAISSHTLHPLTLYWYNTSVWTYDTTCDLPQKPLPCASGTILCTLHTNVHSEAGGEALMPGSTRHDTRECFKETFPFRTDSLTLNAMEPPPSFPPTPERYGNGRRETWPTHPAAAADTRYPPWERRAGTPSRGGAILGSLCGPRAQKACLSSSIEQNRQKFLLPTTRWGTCTAIRPLIGRRLSSDKTTPYYPLIGLSPL